MRSIHLSSDRKLAVPVDIATEAIAILGKRGSGKTSTAVVLVEELTAAGVPVIVVDTVGVWWGLRTSADGRRDGLPFVIFGGEHGDVPLEEQSGKIIADAILDNDLSAIVDTSDLSKAAARRFLTVFVTRVYQRKASDRTPLHVVFDEADELAPQRTAPEGAHLLGAMEDFVRRGRSRGLGSTLVTQRPAVLNKDVLTQVEVLIAMRMTGPTDIKAIDEWTRQHSDEEEAARVKQTLSSLPTGTGWLWSPQWLEMLAQVSFRPRTTFDSSATPKVGQTRIIPRIRAEIDLAKLGADIAATVERAKADDPKTLRAELDKLRRQLAAPAAAGETSEPKVVEVPVEVVREVPVEVPVLADEQVKQLRALADDLSSRLTPLTDALAAVDDALARVGAAGLARTEAEPNRKAAPRSGTLRAVTPPPRAEQPRATAARPAQAAARPQATPADSSIELRSGARRMVEALGRMAPLRLTKAQWGTVAKLKTSGGTWSTYLSDIRRFGLIDEGPAGYTLTDAGFDYLGGRPEPMTAAELQNHYRSILRSGAVKMLDALIDSYPEGMTRVELGEAADIAITGGTFSTYLSDLVRNGLADRSGDVITATSVLMHGANL